MDKLPQLVLTALFAGLVYQYCTQNNEPADMKRNDHSFTTPLYPQMPEMPTSSSHDWHPEFTSGRNNTTFASRL